MSNPNPAQDLELDGVVGAALKTLDGGTPAGYFDGLSGRIASRLEEPMQSGPTVTGTNSDSSNPPPSALGLTPTANATADADDAGSAVPVRPADETSGLHDIRDLARSTKQRMSARRPSVSPVEEDPLATSSAGWKAVALPEPARMVSLPALTELPAASKAKAKAEAAAQKAEAAAQAKADAKADKETRKAAPLAADAVADRGPQAAIATLPTRTAAAREPVAGTPNRTSLYAAIGAVVAIAAGAAIYLGTRTHATADHAMVATAAEPARAPAPQAAAPAPVPVVVAPPAPAPVDPPVADPVPTVAVAQPTTPTKSAGHAAKPTADAGKHVDATSTAPGGPTSETPKKPDAKKAGAGGKDGEPSFDDLLKEAGADQKHEAAPKLAKKELSGGDIRVGMGSVQGKAQGCYQGTGGTVPIKVSVAPSGKVTKVVVGGTFGGTPTGQCVAAAVEGASFPAWDGAPMTISYSYLLSE